MLPDTLLSLDQSLAVARVITFVDMMAVAVFAISGALVAARREMDLLSFIFVGTVTGIGGGTLRDLILGARPVWVTQPDYLVICIVASVITFWAARLLSSRYRALVWMDAVGVGMYAVTGAQKAAVLGAAPVVCVLMGVMTAAFGGLMRDIMCGEKSPLLFNREVYATAAITGASVYLILRALDLPVEVQAAGGFCAGFGLRAGAIIFGWGLPTYRRPARPLDGPDRPDPT